jgi:uncharacterized Zn-finger protein
MIPKCDKCDVTFSSFQMLEKHNIRKYPCDRILECNICKKTFSTSSSLKRHTNRKIQCKPMQITTLEKMTSHVCHFCYKTFASKQSMVRHFNTCEIKHGGLSLLFKKVLDLTGKDKIKNKKIKEMEEEIKKLKTLELEKNQNTLFDGTVYFVNAENTNMFKIGYTKQSMYKRLSNLQTGCPLNLSVYKTVGCSDPVILENYLHRCFNDKKIRGEWFNITFEEVENLVEFLQGNSKYEI